MGDTRHLAFVDEHYVQKRKSLKTDDVVLEMKSYEEKTVINIQNKCLDDHSDHLIDCDIMHMMTLSRLFSFPTILICKK